MIAQNMGQQMAPLPASRVTIGRPFASTGIDYFGPMWMGIGNKRRQKAWGCIFVCTRTRAVHIELVESLTSSSFIQALVRFKNRRGHPIEIYSDNASTFKGGSKEIGEWLEEWENSGDAAKATKTLKIDWKFHAPGASHTAGHYESLIRPTRRILEAISDENQIQTREELLTLLTEVERILNERPLQSVTSEPGMPTPLTPLMLLAPHSDTMTIPEGLPPGAPYHHRRWRLVQHLTQVFWKRWTSEYLQTLQKRMKWQVPVREASIGDLVLMISENKARGDWPRAVVESLHPSNDDHIRKVVVRMPQGKTFVRDIRKLVLLEPAESFDDNIKQEEISPSAEIDE